MIGEQIEKALADVASWVDASLQKIAKDAQVLEELRKERTLAKEQRLVELAEEAKAEYERVYESVKSMADVERDEANRRFKANKYNKRKAAEKARRKAEKGATKASKGGGTKSSPSGASKR